MPYSIQASSHPHSQSQTKAPSIITIGNFDGVHVGHQTLINTLCSFAKNLDFRENFLKENKDFAQDFKFIIEKFQISPKAIFNDQILTFSPHPATILNSRQISQISTDEHRFLSIKKLNPSQINIIFFNTEIAKLSCEEFCLNLIENYNLKILFIGHDFKMGHDRVDFSQLKKMGKKLGFCVYQLPAICLNSKINFTNQYANTAKYISNKHCLIICSTNIRLALANAEIELAKAMLGTYFSIYGLVVHGAKRGGDLLGFPTANILEDSFIVPKNGVYLTRTQILSEKYQNKVFNSITNIGYNPTFDNQKKSIETFIFDFNEDIYGLNIQIQFLQFLRDEKKFNSITELSMQIKKDIEQSKKNLQNLNSPL